ncbi:pilus assembly protein PilY [Acidithiobacillus ferrooxidans F221]|uniref:pilus assembly protein n=1 Tax=Acidithiobacillus ferrooxidans TaxID=920 RepID=UPI001C07902F|nr:PilC/PilY family type IV pilus protein [Acidithiobacillus ferrooxidans]MBU2807682.1 pilus assembly protein PilY [Acidithiobacillus ferrooxidans F221]
MSRKILIAIAVVVYIGGALSCAEAVTITDNFTGATANAANNWKPYGDACLTAGSGSGAIPACTSILGSNSQTSQSVGSGALLLTPPSNSSEGAIISQNPFNASNGITVTFNTYTFGGGGYVGGYGNLTYPNSYGISHSTVTTNNSLDSNNGADSIGFYLINAVIGSTASEGTALTSSGKLSKTFALGATGGSFGYDCSNVGNGYNGMPAAYLGLTIDEFGNGVNPGDNTNTGPGFAPNSIAIRGYGNVNQLSIANALNAATNTTTFNASNITTGDVKTACKYGGKYTYTPPNNGGDGDGGGSTPTTTITLPDYPYIKGSFAQLPANQLIANTSASSRTTATPISYKLTITAAGLLSMEYSYNGGAYQQVLYKQSITAGNGPLPSSLLFGFGASTGGANNYHEITCFQAEPANQSNSSSSVNVQQSGELQTTTQVYLAFYSPNNWWGSLTAQLIQVNHSTGAITVDPTAEWDASCALTGGTCVATGTTVTGQAWDTLPVITWSGTGGVPFTWNSGISTTEQRWLNGDGASNPAYGFGQNLLHYLKGDTIHDATSFIASTTTPSFRTRTKILGDIVDSSPVWVGGPSENLPATFSDAINPTVTFSENANRAQTYAQFANAESERENVVYVGANDGMLHGFQAGFYKGTTYNSSTNNGDEVLAYVPYAVLQDFNKQVNTANDYAYPGYGHNFYVDATPGTGDVFYGNEWHTWLASGLGTGGRGLFVLDINKPTNFKTSNAASLVKGDYTFANSGYNPTGPFPPAQMSCVNGPATCSYQQTAGNITGTPIIRLMNNGDYAIISGNGFNSDDGQAGVYIFLINHANGALSQTIFLGTGAAGTGTAAPDGIAYVSSADLNGNHIADYLYAGDIDGNLWRFNVTSSNPANWHASYYGQGTTPTPLFTTQTGQPISTQVLVDSEAGPSGAQQVMLQFGTGQQTPLTNISGAGYSSTAQSIYGVWDWDMSAWDALPGATQYRSLPVSSSSTLPTPLKYTNLQEQTLTNPGIASSGQQGVNLSANNVCWPGSASCAATSTADPAYGWYVNLPSVSSSGTNLYQQVIYNPTLIEGSAVFDTTIPPYVNALTCNNGLQSGYTLALNPLTGGAVANGFFRSSGNYGTAITMGGVAVSGLELNATGSPSVLNANGVPIMVQQTVSGNPVVTEVAPGGGIGKEVNWAQLR